MRTKYYCIDCNKELKDSRSIRCRSCANKLTNLKHGQTTVEVYCLDCNKLLSKLAYYYNVARCRSCASKERLKDPTKHPQYINGASFESYTLAFTESLKTSIRDRDNRECQLCHKKEIELKRKLDVHHIDYNKKNCNETNLISLCLKCHRKTNGNRIYWLQYFIKFMEEKLCIKTT